MQEIKRLERIRRTINTMQVIGRDCNNDCGYALLNCVLNDVHSLNGWRMDFGNENSGNHGHAGRPGHVGGSAPQGEGGETESPKSEAASEINKLKNVVHAAASHYINKTPYGNSATDSVRSLKALPDNARVTLSNGVEFIKAGKWFNSPLGDMNESNLAITLCKAIENGIDFDISIPNGASYTASISEEQKTEPINVVKAVPFSLPKIFNDTPLSSRKETWEAMVDKAYEVWNKCAGTVQSALNDYTNTDYRRINDVLRGLESPDNYAAATKDLNRITTAIAKSKYPFDKQLIRGIGKEGLKAMLGAAGQGKIESFDNLSSEQLNGLLKNKPMTELGFASCGSSENGGFTDKDVQLHILAPAGTQMMYIQPFSSAGYSFTDESLQEIKSQDNSIGEDETILQQGTEFRCYGAQKKGDKIHVYLKVVKQTPRKIKLNKDGGEGSGFRDHEGRPGKVGGSLPADGEAGGEEPTESREVKAEEESKPKQKTKEEIDAQIKESVRQAEEKMAREAGFNSFKEWQDAQWKEIEAKAEREENENESDFENEEEDFEPTPENSKDWIDPETEVYFTSDPKRVQKIEDLLTETYYSDREDHLAFQNKLTSALDKIEDGTVLKFTDMDSDGNEYPKCEITRIDGHWELESSDDYDTKKFTSTKELATYIDQKFDADNLYRVKETYTPDFEQNYTQWDDYTKGQYTFNPLPTSGEPAWRDRAEQTVKVWDSSTPEEQKALRDYTSEDYQWINQVERGTFERTDLHSQEELKAKSDALASMIDKCEMKKTTQLVRGVDYSALQAIIEQFSASYSKSKLKNMSARELGEVLVGQTITEQGFSSCSSGGQTKYGDSEVQMHILCPKGTKGIYAEPYSNWGQKWDKSKAVEPPPTIRDENETILQRGTSFYVDHVTKGGDYTALWVRVVGQGDRELEWW